MKIEPLKKLIAYLANAIYHYGDVRCETDTALEVAQILATLVNEESDSTRTGITEFVTITEADLEAAEPLTPTRTLTAWLRYRDFIGCGVGYERFDYDQAEMLDVMVSYAIFELPGAAYWD